MEIARIFLIFSLILFLSTAAFSYARADSTISISLRARIPASIEINPNLDYSSGDIGYSANFDFHGSVAILNSDEFSNDSRYRNFKVITVTSN